MTLEKLFVLPPAPGTGFSLHMQETCGFLRPSFLIIWPIFPRCIIIIIIITPVNSHMFLFSGPWAISRLSVAIKSFYKYGRLPFMRGEDHKHNVVKM